MLPGIENKQRTGSMTAAAGRNMKIDTSNYIGMSKTVFPWNYDKSLTFNLGELVPVAVTELLPGDTLAQSLDVMVRLISPTIKAPMENLKIEFSHWKVPYRILYDNWKKVMGERDDYENPDSTYSVPLINFIIDKLDEDGNPTGEEEFLFNHAKSILAYFGLPVRGEHDVYTLKGITKLVSNAYALIWNNFFRDQNLQSAKEVDTSDNDINYIAHTDPDFDFHKSAPDKYTGGLAKVLKDIDYFVDTYTDPQKGEKTLINIADLNLDVSGSVGINGRGAFYLGSDNNGDDYDTVKDFKWNSQVSAGEHKNAFATLTYEMAGVGENVDVPLEYVTGLDTSHDLHINGNNISVMSINDLREAMKTQRLKEIDLVAGTRYFETLKSYFNVTNRFAELDYPEYIGGSNDVMVISQVVQTSVAAGDTPQGNVAGYLAHALVANGYITTALEHSMVITLATVKQKHKYQNGVHKMFSRKTKMDFYQPALNGLGFQNVDVKEIYGHLSSGSLADIFGYAPYGERYRKPESGIAGQLLANSTDMDGNANSLGAWTMADNYDSAFVLNEDWKMESPDFLDNTLAIGSELSDQFIMTVKFSGAKISIVDPLGVPKI